LGLHVASGERQCFVAHAVGLGVIARGVPNSTELDPEQWVVRLDAHGALDRSGGKTEVAARHLLVGLGNQSG
jgi:hypothetical protein